MENRHDDIVSWCAALPLVYMVLNMISTAHTGILAHQPTDHKHRCLWCHARLSAWCRLFNRRFCSNAHAQLDQQKQETLSMERLMMYKRSDATDKEEKNVQAQIHY
jgi:hypothetical protein